MSVSSPSPHPSFCLGCGKDHQKGRGCGYDRDVQWTAYSKQERLKHMRLFPVGVGLAAAAVMVFFLVNPPEAPHFYFIGIALPALIAVLFGGFGIKAMIEEVRKRRFRVSSTDGRDRALVAMVGKELRYAFGESLRYRSTPVLDYAAALSSPTAFALGDELADLLDQDFAAWVRKQCDDDTLLRDGMDPNTRLAILFAITILGLTARGEASLSVGRYKAWGRGGGKMPGTTRGVELALEAVPDRKPTAPLEQRLLALAQPNDESPTALDSLVDAVANGRDAQTLLAALQEQAEESPEGAELDLEAAREAWGQAQREEEELVMNLLQHVLPGRPGTIGAEPAE